MSIQTARQTRIGHFARGRPLFFRHRTGGVSAFLGRSIYYRSVAVCLSKPTLGLAADSVFDLAMSSFGIRLIIETTKSGGYVSSPCATSLVMRQVITGNLSQVAIIDESKNSRRLLWTIVHHRERG